jgi:hypothetical protein
LNESGVGKKTLQVFILLFIFSYFIFQVLITFLGIQNGLYTSDGFHYYSLLRNTVDGLGLYEGPTFQFLLGNHTYLTLLLLSPLTMIDIGPPVLGVVSVMLHFLSAFLIYLISEAFKLDMLSRLALALLFLFTPYVLDTSLGTIYMFQPDFLSVPLALFLFWSAQKRNVILFVSSLVVLVGVKEEWILWAPIFVVFIALVLRINPLLTKFRWLFLLGYLGASASSYIVLQVFRSLNAYNHVPSLSSFSISTDLFGNEMLKDLLLWCPILSILFLGVAVSRSGGSIFVLLSVLGIVVARSLVDQIIYGAAPPPWGAHSLLTPVMGIALVYGVSNTIIGLRDKVRSPILIPSSLISLVTLFGLFWGGGIASSIEVQLDRGSAVMTREGQGTKLEFQRLAEEARPLHEDRGYFISDEFLMNEFMDSSHVSTSWLVHQANKEEIIEKASFAVVSNDKHELISLLLQSNFVVCARSSLLNIALYCPL